MKLWQRLFLALALLATAALVGQLAWQQWSFARGFSDYLDAIALGQAQQVGRRLVQLHADEGGWERLRMNRGRMGGLVSPDGQDGPPEPRQQPGIPPAGGGHTGDWRPPAQERAPAHGPIPEMRADPRARGPQSAGGRGPGPRPDDMSIGARFGLFDVDGSYVAGNADAASSRLRLPLSADGRAIGELRIAALPSLPAGAESEFARQQLRGALYAAACVLLLSLLLAFALARRLRQPLDALAEGARRLAAGEYSHRCDAHRRDEIGALARDFNRLAEALEQARQSRQRWSADVAHELRTPLTVLRSELHLLADGVRPLDAAAVASLQQEIDQLTQLVEDLNQLTLADAGALEYRFGSIDLADAAADAADRHRPRLRQSGLTLDNNDSGEPLPVRADRRRLAQALDNLLVNAGRYTDAPGQIRLRVSRAADEARLQLDDSPPGVPESDLPRLFDRWYRADPARSRLHGGSGLGLAIARAIIDAHGGRISARPSELGGLHVDITLPLELAGTCANAS